MSTEIRFQIEPITDELQPADEQEKESRADFLCKALLAHVKQNVTFALNRCRSGELGEDARKAVEEKADEFTTLEILKESSVTILVLLARLVGANPPPWVREYLSMCIEKCDLHIYPNPPAGAIVVKRKKLAPEAMIADVGAAAAGLVGLSAESAPGQMLRDQVRLSHQFSYELLLLSLTQPEEVLAAHLQLYGR